jgi:ABC-type phosphate/phosphonate transport system substrate-binding protein
MRTRNVLSLCAMVLVWAAGCQQDGAAGGKMVQVGSTKAGFLGPPAEFRAIHPRLEELFGQRVVFSAQPDGEALAHQLAQGQIAYAFMSATEFCSIEDTSKLTLLASGINALGKSSRNANIVVRAKSHLKTIADCKGKRFAFGTHGDLLTDIAAQHALGKAGVSTKDLLIDLALPFTVDGRLYLRDDVAKTIVGDLTVNAGVVDEVQYAQMKDTGGSFILGPSKDQFEIVGTTIAVPEMVVVAGPAASAADTEKLRGFLLTQAKNDPLACDQLGVRGFVEPDKAAYDAAREALVEGR